MVSVKQVSRTTIPLQLYNYKDNYTFTRTIIPLLCSGIQSKGVKLSVLISRVHGAWKSHHQLLNLVKKPPICFFFEACSDISASNSSKIDPRDVLNTTPTSFSVNLDIWFRKSLYRSWKSFVLKSEQVVGSSRELIIGITRDFKKGKSWFGSLCIPHHGS